MSTKNDTENKAGAISLADEEAVKQVLVSLVRYVMNSRSQPSPAGLS